MAYRIEIPVNGLQAPASRGSRKALTETMKRIITTYGKFIKTASEESNIPASVITAFIGVESGGNPLASPSGTGTCHPTIGLMQWNRAYTRSTLEREYKANRLTDTEKLILSKYGINFDKNGKTRNITCNDQKIAELNILIGSIILGQLISELSSRSKGWALDDNELLRLDKIISVYNAGMFGKTGKIATESKLGGVPVDTTTVKKYRDLVGSFNNTTKNYIDLMMGKDGYLDILTSDLKDMIYG